MADAQYVVDIAAAMSGGDHTMQELDALTENLTASGKGADHFQQAMKQLGAELAAAQAATLGANEALAAGQDEYAALEKSALQASKAAERAAVKNGGVVPPELAAQARSANAAVDAYAATLAELEANAAAAAGREDELARTMANVRKLSSHADKSIAGQAENLEKLSSAIGSVGGPIGQLGQGLLRPVQGFAKLSGSMGEARAAALLLGVASAAVVAGILAVGAAAIAGAAKVAAWAVGLADARRESELATEAFTAANPALAGLPFDDIARDTGLATKQLQGLAKSLKAADVSAAELPDALRAAALAERALGSGGAQDFIDQIKEAKGAVGQLAAETQSKFGGIVERQLLGLEAQSDRLRSNIDELFGGLNIEPVLEGMQILVGLFDKNTAAGRAMRFLFESVFQPIIDHAREAAYVVEAFALGFLIGLTKVYIAVKPAIKAISELFGFEDTSLTDLLEVAKNAGEIAAYAFVGLATAFGLIVAGFGAVVAAGAGFLALIIGIPIAIQQTAMAIGETLGKAISDAINFIREIDITTVGSDLIAGLAAGITSSAGIVIDAISGAVKGAIASAKSLLGIASPSKVFAELGEFTGEGFTMGVESENDSAQAALADMTSPESAVASIKSPTDGAAAAGGESATNAAASGVTASGTQITIAAGAFVFQGVKDAQQADSLFRESLRRVLAGEVTAVAGSGEERAA